MRRCRKFYINGKNAGHVEKFVESLPGLPDNIRYDGEGHYLIALATEFSTYWDLAYRYRFIRKVSGMVVRYLGMPSMAKNSGFLSLTWTENQLLTIMILSYHSFPVQSRLEIIYTVVLFDTPAFFILMLINIIVLGLRKAAQGPCFLPQ